MNNNYKPSNAALAKIILIMLTIIGVVAYTGTLLLSEKIVAIIFGLLAAIIYFLLLWYKRMDKRLDWPVIILALAWIGFSEFIIRSLAIDIIFLTPILALLLTQVYVLIRDRGSKTSN